MSGLTLTLAPSKSGGGLNEVRNFSSVMMTQEPYAPLLVDLPPAWEETAELFDALASAQPELDVTSGRIKTEVPAMPAEPFLRRLDPKAPAVVITGGAPAALAATNLSNRATTTAITTQQRSVFGVGVDGNARIGLILDISPSMEPVVERVLHEVYGSFPSSATVTIDSGAIRIENQKQYQHRLADNQFKHFYQLDELPHVDFQVIHALQRFTQGRAVHTFEFLEGAGLLMRSGADVIYWVTDFRDDSDPEALAYLKSWLMSRGVKLYVHSVDVPAPQDIRKLAQLTGGTCIVQPVM
ncbi:MAG: hypothetical protein AAF571_08805 [Verrucomicrobiota bacterium]